MEVLLCIPRSLGDCNGTFPWSQTNLQKTYPAVSKGCVIRQYTSSSSCSSLRGEWVPYDQSRRWSTCRYNDLVELNLWRLCVWMSMFKCPVVDPSIRSRAIQKRQRLVCDPRNMYGCKTGKDNPLYNPTTQVLISLSLYSFHCSALCITSATADIVAMSSYEFSKVSLQKWSYQNMSSLCTLKCVKFSHQKKEYRLSSYINRNFMKFNCYLYLHQLWSVSLSTFALFIPNIQTSSI